jgi:hypothetical protein
MSNRYDLDRAATAGGFAGGEDDRRTGREVAYRLHGVISRRTADGVGLDVQGVVDATVAACDDLWDWQELRDDQRGAGQAALANAVTAMLRDLIQQAREAKGPADTP